MAFSLRIVVRGCRTAIGVFDDATGIQDYGPDLIQESARPPEPDAVDLTPRGRSPIGIPAIDELLGGGLPSGTATLLLGARQTGKHLLQRWFFQHGSRQRIPSVYVSTEDGAGPTMMPAATGGVLLDLRDLAAIPEADHEADQAFDARDHAEPLFHAIAQALAGVGESEPWPCRITMQSLAAPGPQRGTLRTFRFLRSLLHHLRRTGSTALIGLESTRFSDAEVQTLKLLCPAMIRLRASHGHHFLRVEGLHPWTRSAWIEYGFDSNGFRLGP